MKWSMHKKTGKFDFKLSCNSNYIRRDRIKKDSVDEFIETVVKAYEEKFGHKAPFYVTNTVDGGKELV